MRVLALAPQPFYSERGTPISMENLLRIMSARGWRVDLLTYAEGADVSLPGLTIRRIPSIPGVRHVPPGFSLEKVLSDVLLTAEAFRAARRERFDLVYGVEEAVFIAAAVNKLTGVPYVYDMDSILSEQLIDHFPWLRHAHGALRYCEEIAVTGCLGVVAVSESLARSARELSSEPFVTHLEDRTQLGPPKRPVESLRDLVGPDRTIVLYVGNLEHYQGIDLLIAGVAAAARRSPRLAVALVVIGGTPAEVARYRALAAGLEAADSVYLIGPRPVKDLRGYLEQADMLVSPRICGTNTPMKIYSFLDSGVPLLATRLPTHLQVLDDENACLFEPTPEALAEAVVELGLDAARRRRLTRAAARAVAHRFSRPAYELRAHRFLAEIERLVEERSGRNGRQRERTEESRFRQRADSRSPDTIRPHGEVPRPGRSVARSSARPLPA